MRETKIHSERRIAYLGPEGTFTQQAMQEYFGFDAKGLPFSSIPEIFRAVESGSCEAGVVPVENSTEGSVTHTLDHFLNSSLIVAGEVMLGIHHYLLSHSKQLSPIREVFSHQQGIAQCRAWLEERLPHAKCTAVSSNAEGARLASFTPSSAAIAGKKAAELYGLSILESQIEDEKNNTTRFWILSTQEAAKTGEDKTSLLLTVSNRPGVLFEALEPIARHRIDMTKIESRPSRRGNWNYVFFIDVAGHREDPVMAQMLKELAERVDALKILGSYPRAKNP